MDYGFARVFFKVKLLGEGRPRGYVRDQKTQYCSSLYVVSGRREGNKGDLGIDLMGVYLMNSPSSLIRQAGSAALSREALQFKKKRL